MPLGRAPFGIDAYAASRTSAWRKRHACSPVISLAAGSRSSRSTSVVQAAFRIRRLDIFDERQHAAEVESLALDRRGVEQCSLSRASRSSRAASSACRAGGSCGAPSCSATCTASCSRNSGLPPARSVTAVRCRLREASAAGQQPAALVGAERSEPDRRLTQPGGRRAARDGRGRAGAPVRRSAVWRGRPRGRAAAARPSGRRRTRAPAGAFCATAANSRRKPHGVASPGAPSPRPSVPATEAAAAAPSSGPRSASRAAARALPGAPSRGPASR